MLYHTNTDNLSFIETHLQLKKRGIRNNKFFLELRNPELGAEGFTPHAPNLTLEQKAMIAVECSMNPWYFFREVVRIPVAGGESKFLLHLGNLAMLWLMMHNVNSIVLLPRQNFKTMSAITYFLHAYELATSNSTIVFSNKAQEDSKNNLERFKDIRNLLPQWLLKTDHRDVDNKTGISSASTNNSIQTKAGATDERAADKMGRGMTVPFLWFDEFAFLKYNNIIYEAATLAHQQAAQDAERNRKPHFKLITTTPNNADIDEGAYCMEMINKAAKFGEWWYDKDDGEVRQLLANTSENDFAYMKYDWRDLGRDEEWYVDNCRAVNMDRLKIRREINLEWTLGTDKSVFAEELLEKAQSLTKPSVSVPFGDWSLEAVEMPEPGRPVIIAADVAAGLDQDSSALAVIDAITMRILAWFKSATIEIKDFIELIELAHKVFFPSAPVVVERSPISLAMIEIMMEGPLKQWLVYEVPDDKTVETPAPGVNRRSRKTNFGGSQDRRRYGVVTSVTSRAGMMDILRHDLIHNPDVFQSAELMDEIAGLQRNKSGRIEHAQGKHDDLLMAYLVGRWALAAVASCNKMLSRAKALGNALGKMSKYLEIGAKGPVPRSEPPPPVDPFSKKPRGSGAQRIWELNHRF